MCSQVVVVFVPSVCRKQGRRIGVLFCADSGVCLIKEEFGG